MFPLPVQAPGAAQVLTAPSGIGQCPFYQAECHSDHIKGNKQDSTGFPFSGTVTEVNCGFVCVCWGSYPDSSTCQAGVMPMLVT